MATQVKSKWSKLKLTNEGRSRLRSAIRLQPAAAQFVKSGAEISKLNKVGLLNLAVKLGIDPVSLLQSNEDPGIGSIDAGTGAFARLAFSGVVEFDFTMSLLGKTVTRKARVCYSHTPDWAYFDTKTQTEVLPFNEGSSYGFEVQSVVDGVVHYTGDDAIKRGRTVRRKLEVDWEECNDMTELGIWSDEMWDAIDDLIDKDCRAQDAANRKA